MTYSIWINANYDFLRTWSKRWAHAEWAELLSLYTVYLQKNWIRKMEYITEEERIKFTQTWFKNMKKWSNSEFNRDIGVNNFDDVWSPIDEPEDQLLDIRAEADRGDIADWLVDLHRNFDEKDCFRLIKIRKIYLDLATHEKVLYDLYFTKMMSLREIAKQIGVPHMAVYSMVNDLKQKITIKYDDYN